MMMMMMMMMMMLCCNDEHLHVERILDYYETSIKSLALRLCLATREVDAGACSASQFSRHLFSEDANKDANKNTRGSLFEQKKIVTQSSVLSTISTVYCFDDADDA